MTGARGSTLSESTRRDLGGVLMLGAPTGRHSSLL